MQEPRGPGKPIDCPAPRLYSPAMKTRGIALALLFALILAALGQFFYFFGDLPSRVATRYDAYGQPEMTLHKAAFAAFYLGTIVFFSVYGIVARYYAHKLPDRYLKIIPSHAHWLAPENRPATVAWVSGALVWVAVLTLALFAATFTLIMLSNTGQPVSSMSTTLGFLNTIYLTALFLLVMGFRKRFHLKQ